MTANLPQYENPEVLVNKFNGDISLHSNNGVEPLELRGYQMTSPSGQLSTSNWTSWDALGLDSDTWFEANPSATQLAELNLTSSATIAPLAARSFGDVYTGGPGGPEDLVFEYLEPGNPNAIQLAVNYIAPEFMVGDLDFDADVDGADWVLYSAGLGVDLSGMTMFDAFQMGDMDNDFDNDYHDFLAFKGAFDAFNGPGAFQAFARDVPEPATYLLAATCALAVGPRRIRFSPLVK